jgi:hypothetical protein
MADPDAERERGEHDDHEASDPEFHGFPPLAGA